jgi:hypothetical protein
MAPGAIARQLRHTIEDTERTQRPLEQLRSFIGNTADQTKPGADAPGFVVGTTEAKAHQSQRTRNDTANQCVLRIPVPNARDRGKAPVLIQGLQKYSGGLYSYPPMEEWIRASHPLRRIPKRPDQAIGSLHSIVCHLDAFQGRPSVREGAYIKLFLV